MPCHQRQMLLEQLAAAAKAHTDSLRNMKGLNTWEFDRAWDDAESLRLTKELAQKALTEHEEQHGCSDSFAATP
jgi:hypothetical protein